MSGAAAIAARPARARVALGVALATGALLIAAPWPGGAHASTGVSRPPASAAASLPEAVHTRAGASLRPAGQGRLNFLGLAVYDAALWTVPGFRAGSFADHVFALELHYLRRFSAADIARASLEQMQRHGPIDPAQAERWRAELMRLLPDVRKGERIAGLNLPGRGLALFHEGRSLGEVEDPRFAQLFFAIWLGEATSAPALRQALVGGGGS